MKLTLRGLVLSGLLLHGAAGSTLRFEPNRGQAPPQVQFLVRGPGYQVYLESGGATFPSAGLRWTLQEARRGVRPEGVERCRSTSNYFIGSDRSRWRTGIPNYAGVKYKAVYPGVDLVYHARERQLEYDFMLRPGANPGQIRIAFEGARGIRVDANGDLVLQTATGEIRQHKPGIYQEMGGVRHSIEGGYAVCGREVGFRLRHYDPALPLVIDPTLSYSSYLGGSALDIGNGIALDPNGNIYVVGETTSADFPSLNPLQPSTGGGSDAFITMFDPTGALVYSTYLGGSGSDRGLGIAVDNSGNAYITGTTQSLDFPTMNPLQAANGGESDAFVAELDPTGGVLVFATYLGGGLTDNGNAIALDSSGNIYVTGETFSADFPTMNPLQANNAGLSDTFIAEIAADGSGLVYSTYLGGGLSDRANSIAVDSAGNAYITGRTGSNDFPQAQGQFMGGDYDAFVAALDPTGALLYSMYLGGSGNDNAFGIAVDAAGSIYVAGGTSSPDFPVTAGAFQQVNFGPLNAFVVKIDSTASVVYATYLGGSFKDRTDGIAVDAAGNAVVVGRASSSDFWITDAAIQPTYGGGTCDAFVTKLNDSGTGLLFSTYFGGSDLDQGNAVALDASGNIYATGATASADLATANPAQASFGGGTSDAFVVVLTDIPAASVSAARSPR